ncbi:MAG: ATP-binding cassette domain-containing protein [Caulobacteraceae bacterium]|nr:ATP-binding cassette domain-containing protein [Caulobacteraceae bacterium]
MGDALVLDRVCKRYGDFQAVRELSFSAPRGRILGFLGPNGAGKTTTLRMLLGLIEPTAGRIEVLGAGDARAVRARIGFLPEERGLYRRMTPLDTIVFFAGLKGVPTGEARRRALALLEAQGLGAVARRPIKALSKGMAQKVQLLAALAHEPELVLLDEPFSGLDPVNQQSLEAMIRELARRGATVVFSTHVMQHAERLCDQVVLLARGRKAFDGSLAEARAAAPRRLVLEGRVKAAAAASLPGVAAVEATEALAAGAKRLTLILSPQAEAQAALKAAFAQGLDFWRFDLREPSLHDAFIVLTGDAA